MFIILNARWMIKDESEWMDIHIMLNTCCHSIMLRHFSVLMIKVTWLTLKIYLLGWTCKLVWFECWLDPLIEWLQQCQNCLASCHHKSISNMFSLQSEIIIGATIPLLTGTVRSMRCSSSRDRMVTPASGTSWVLRIPGRWLVASGYPGPGWRLRWWPAWRAWPPAPRWDRSPGGTAGCPASTCGSRTAAPGRCTSPL